mmetsp:Transcript_39095/g.94099  ORF Transcript_39095/g.94099 Transcript_39095/m.94099 type:complete len:616 (-) Transcript_39095:397-2244(-)
MEVTAKKSLAQPHNCYNIFFILERQMLIHAMKGSSDGDGTPARVSDEKKIASSVDVDVDLNGYDSLSLPELPQRYKGLTLENGWYIPGKNAKRKHVKTHGLTSCSFAGLARTVSSNWRVADSETKDYCNTVASIIKERYANLLKAGGIGSTKKSRLKKKKLKRRSSMPNMGMADIPNQGNLPLSLSTHGEPSPYIANSGTMAPNTISVTPEEHAYYNYLLTIHKNQENTLISLPSAQYDNMGFETRQETMNKKQQNTLCSWASAQYTGTCFEVRQETQLHPGASFKTDVDFSELNRGCSSGDPRCRTSDPTPLYPQFVMNNVNFQPNQVHYNPENNSQEQESCESSSNSKRMTCSNLAIFEDTGASDLAAGSESPKVCSGIGAKKSGRIFLDESSRSSAPMEHEITSFCQEKGMSFKAKSSFGDCSRGRSNCFPRRRASNPMPLDYQISAPAPLNPENNPQENGGSSSNSKRTSCSDLSTFYEESGGSSSNSKRMSSSDLSMFYDMAFSRMSAQIGLEMASQPNPKQRRMRLDSNITPRLDEFLGQEWMNRPIEKSNLAMESEFPNDPVTTTMGELDIDCSPIPHRNAPNNHSNKTSQEVDICDSVIRDMASGMW